MTLIVETPDTRAPERDYILSMTLGEFLGLKWRRVPMDRYDTRITLQDHAGEVRMPDILLQTPDENWLTIQSLPTQPLAVWDSSELGLPITLIDSHLPVIYGGLNSFSSNRSPAFPLKSSIVYLPLDIFGSAFFMLTRYEEIVKPDRDEHDRFPAQASLAYKEGFLERPIIDEYVEVLWAILKKLWPAMVRKERRFQIKVSHDVDRPSRYQFGSKKKFLRSIGGDIIKRGDIINAARAPLIRWGKSTSLHNGDPYNTFEWIMDVVEEHGLISAFYFICGHTSPIFDSNYEIEHAAIRSLMRRINERGHEIGLHPSYNTYQDPDAISIEANRLRRICDEEGIKQDHWGGRMHYLRWETPTTLRGWDQAKMTYDSTLGFADRPGFRCGTCHEYQAFDLLERKQFVCLIRPLVVMECSVLGEKYLAIKKNSTAIRLMLELKKTTKMFSGIFSLLWHNSELRGLQRKEIFKQIVQYK